MLIWCLRVNVITPLAEVEDNCNNGLLKWEKSAAQICQINEPYIRPNDQPGNIIQDECFTQSGKLMW